MQASPEGEERKEKAQFASPSPAASRFKRAGYSGMNLDTGSRDSSLKDSESALLRRRKTSIEPESPMIDFGGRFAKTNYEKSGKQKSPVVLEPESPMIDFGGRFAKTNIDSNKSKKKGAKKKKDKDNQPSITVTEPQAFENSGSKEIGENSSPSKYQNSSATPCEEGVNNPNILAVKSNPIIAEITAFDQKLSVIQESRLSATVEREKSSQENVDKASRPASPSKSKKNMITITPTVPTLEESKKEGIIGPHSLYAVENMIGELSRKQTLDPPEQIRPQTQTASPQIMAIKKPLIRSDSMEKAISKASKRKSSKFNYEEFSKLATALGEEEKKNMNHTNIDITKTVEEIDRKIEEGRRSREISKDKTNKENKGNAPAVTEKDFQPSPVLGPSSLQPGSRPDISSLGVGASPLDVEKTSQTIKKMIASEQDEPGPETRQKEGFISFLPLGNNFQDEEKYRPRIIMEGSEIVNPLGQNFPSQHKDSKRTPMEDSIVIDRIQGKRSNADEKSPQFYGEDSNLKTGEQIVDQSTEKQNLETIALKNTEDNQDQENMHHSKKSTEEKQLMLISIPGLEIEKERFENNYLQKQKTNNFDSSNPYYSSGLHNNVNKSNEFQLFDKLEKLEKPGKLQKLQSFEEAQRQEKAEKKVPPSLETSLKGLTADQPLPQSQILSNPPLASPKKTDPAFVPLKPKFRSEPFQMPDADLTSYTESYRQSPTASVRFTGKKKKLRTSSENENKLNSTRNKGPGFQGFSKDEASKRRSQLVLREAQESPTKELAETDSYYAVENMRDDPRTDNESPPKESEAQKPKSKFYQSKRKTSEEILEEEEKAIQEKFSGPGDNFKFPKLIDVAVDKKDLGTPKPEESSPETTPIRRREKAIDIGDYPSKMQRIQERGSSESKATEFQAPEKDVLGKEISGASKNTSKPQQESHKNQNYLFDPSENLAAFNQTGMLQSQELLEDFKFNRIDTPTKHFQPPKDEKKASTQSEENNELQPNSSNPPKNVEFDGLNENAIKQLLDEAMKEKTYLVEKFYKLNERIVSLDGEKEKNVEKKNILDHNNGSMQQLVSFDSAKITGSSQKSGLAIKKSSTGQKKESEKDYTSSRSDKPLFNISFPSPKSSISNKVACGNINPNFCLLNTAKETKQSVIEERRVNKESKKAEPDKDKNFREMREDCPKNLLNPTSSLNADQGSNQPLPNPRYQSTILNNLGINNYIEPIIEEESMYDNPDIYTSSPKKPSHQGAGSTSGLNAGSGLVTGGSGIIADKHTVSAEKGHTLSERIENSNYRRTSSLVLGSNFYGSFGKTGYAPQESYQNTHQVIQSLEVSDFTGKEALIDKNQGHGTNRSGSFKKTIANSQNSYREKEANSKNSGRNSRTESAGNNKQDFSLESPLQLINKPQSTFVINSKRINAFNSGPSKTSQQPSKVKDFQKTKNFLIKEPNFHRNSQVKNALVDKATSPPSQRGPKAKGNFRSQLRKTLMEGRPRQPWVGERGESHEKNRGGRGQMKERGCQSYEIGRERVEGSPYFPSYVAYGRLQAQRAGRERREIKRYRIGRMLTRSTKNVRTEEVDRIMGAQEEGLSSAEIHPDQLREKDEGGEMQDGGVIFGGFDSISLPRESRLFSMLRQRELVEYSDEDHYCGLTII